MTDRASLKQKSRLETPKRYFYRVSSFLIVVSAVCAIKFREVLKPKMTMPAKLAFLLGACFVEQFDL